MNKILRPIALVWVIIPLISSFANPVEKQVYKMIKGYHINEKGGARNLLYEESYNAKGLKTKRTNIFDDFFDFGNDVELTEYTYNNDGQLIKVIDPELIVELYSYNEKGNVIIMKKQFPDGDVVSEKYRYNAVDDLTAKQYYINDQLQHTMEWEYIYDHEGKITTEQEWLRYPSRLEKDDIMSYHKSFTYDANGFVSEEKQHYKSGIIPSNHTFKRNNSGLVLEEAHYFKNELSWRMTFEYNSKAQLSKELSFDESALISTKYYTYNENGDLIREVRDAVNGDYSENVTEYTYW